MAEDVIGDAVGARESAEGSMRVRIRIRSRVRILFIRHIFLRRDSAPTLTLS